jgi:hypothetical protein
LFVHEQLHFAHSVAKLIGYHLGCGHSLPNDFDVEGPFTSWIAPKIALFNNEVMHPFCMYSSYPFCNIWFLAFFNFARPF